AYIITDRDGAGTAFVGSSNLSSTAFRRGIEWNYRVVHSQAQNGFKEIAAGFEELFTHPSSRPLDSEWVRAYSLRRTAPLPRAAGVEPEPVGPPPVPHSVQ